MKKIQYVYHYHAYYKEGAWETAMDGLLRCDDKILSNDDYDNAKGIIATESKTTREIFIDSLSMIGQTGHNFDEIDIDKTVEPVHNENKIKAMFGREFVPPYLEHVQNTIEGRDIAELLYMAFRRGYISRGELE